MSTSQTEQQTVSSNEHEIRSTKVKNLLTAGTNPWPMNKDVSATTLQALREFDADDEPKTYTLAGRLMTRRDHGKTFFANIQDRTGSIQLYIKKADVGDDLFTFFTTNIDLGDIIWVKGTTFRTKKGEVTLKVSDLSLMSKCLHPLPEKYHGLTSVEQRYRQRYLDLMTNTQTREKFVKRSRIIASIRSFLQGLDFLEVETPTLHPIPGGATAKPFTTHHNAYDMELFLRIAPELYLKRLVVGGLDRVFEVSKNYRNEGVSTKHNPEFTSVEFYMAYGDYEDGMKVTEDLFRQLVQENCDALVTPYQDYELDFSKPFERMTIEESVIKVGGLEAEQISESSINETLAQHEIHVRKSATHGEKIFALFEELVEAKLIQPTFITDYPTAVSPLARRDDERRDVAQRFELFMAGMELANGFSELNNPYDQAERFHEQVAARDEGDQEAHHFDADYVTALEYGLPPTVGVGFGVDRLIMLLTNTTTIKDVILFPTMKKLAE